MLLFKRSKIKHKTKQKQILHLDRFKVPVVVYVERRNNSRISLLKDKMNVRLPLHMTVSDRQKELSRLLKWAEDQLKKKDIYGEKEKVRNYFDEKVIEIYGTVWKLAYIQVEGRKRISAQLNEYDYTIYFKGDFNNHSKTIINQISKEILLKLFKQYYAKDIQHRVSQINDKTLKKNFGNVSLKYTNSRWGSCSSQGNISLSLRLLFAPQAVIDYVILHELCHLVEMNHSKHFWNLVNKHMPNYKQHVKWLKQNGHLCDF